MAEKQFDPATCAEDTIAAGTNPWIHDGSGAVVTLETMSSVIAGEDCNCGPIPGVLAPMDTDIGVQRCDECELYPGDLEAAAALARHLGDDHTVWFEVATTPQ